MINKSMLGLLDQAASSLSSLLLAIMVARESSPTAVGAWAVGYGVYTLLLTVSRSAISTTAIIAGREDCHADQVEFDREAVSAAVFAAVGVGLVLLAAAFVFDGDLRNYLALFAIGFPVLIWQDACRFVTIRQGKLGVTAVLDYVWVTLQVVFGLVMISFFASGLMVTTGWLIAAFVSVIVSFRYVSPKISFGRAVQFVRRHKRSIAPLFTESFIGAAATNAQPAILGVVIGLAATGYYRGAASLLGIASALILGLTPIVTVEAVKKHRLGRSLDKLLIYWVALIVVFGLASTIVVVLVPDWLGVELLGETWYGAVGIFPILAAQIIFRGPNSGVLIMLRASQKLRLVVRIRIVHSVTSLLVITFSAAVWGLQGAAWGSLICSAILCIYSTVIYIRVLGKSGTKGES